MIAVEQLVKKIGGTEILRGVSLTLEAGQVAAIIGPSGSGKSTLLRCLNGLEPMDGGLIRVGEDVLDARTHLRQDGALLRRVRRRLGFVFQQFNLFPHLTLLENCILAPVQVLGESKDAAVARALPLLARVGLEARVNAYPRQLSGGQQQRGAIVRALAMQPEALLLDEPTSALDPAMAGEVMAVIADLARSGQAMMVVTHSLSLVRSIAERVHVLADGVTVESGLPGDVLERPQHAVTRRLLAQVV